MNKNIVIVHYNTPDLTECLVKSINKFVDGAIVYIFDNSDKYPFVAKFDNVTVFDNTQGQYINFDKWLENYPNRRKSAGKTNNYASAKHAISVEKCMDLIDDNFMLMDSDILLRKDISELFDEDYCCCAEVIIQPRFNVKRVLPYICFINNKMCKENDVHFFNDKEMYGLYTSYIGDKYDTGASFYRQMESKGMKIKEFENDKYIVHYKAGSWSDYAKKFHQYRQISKEEWLKKYKMYWTDEKMEKVVYTCITGGYDSLREPKEISEGWDYICFTDDTGMTSDVWQIRPLPEETKELSQVKKQRYVKINPHLVLPEYKVSIWVDGSVQVLGNVNEFEETCKKDGVFIYVPQHPLRNCTYAEARVVVSMKKDTKENVDPQIDRYRKEGLPQNNGMLQSNILLRYHNDPGCIKLMEAWFEELKNNSHRDQLSFNYVSWKNSDIPVQYIDKYIYKSKWFNWQRHKANPRAILTAHNAFHIVPKIRTPKKITVNIPKKKHINMSGMRVLK